MNAKTVAARLTLLLGVLAGTAAAAAAEYDPAAAEKYILEAEAPWAQSVASADASVVMHILADAVVCVFDGQVLSQTQAVADAAAGPGDFLSNQLDYAHVRFFGDSAVVQGAENWTRQGDTRGRFIWTDTWLRRDGRWQIVASQDTSVGISDAP
jgi:ketosteroid isomerase-like protein